MRTKLKITKERSLMLKELKVAGRLHWSWYRRLFWYLYKIKPVYKVVLYFGNRRFRSKSYPVRATQIPSGEIWIEVRNRLTDGNYSKINGRLYTGWLIPVADARKDFGKVIDVLLDELVNDERKEE